MKKIYPFLFLLLVFSCTNEDSNSPEAITKKFVTLVGEGDFESAKLLGTLETERFLAFREESMEMVGEDPIQPVVVERVDCIFLGKRADCTFCCDPNGNEMQVPLIKQGKKWLVNINIDALLEDFEKKLEELDWEQKEE